MKRVVLVAMLLVTSVVAHADNPSSLTLEAGIPLGNVNGRIDHLAIDVVRQRLYIAELGNNSIGVVDLKEHKVLRKLTGFSEPQGIVYVPTTDALYVANGSDGSVCIFNAADFAPMGRIDLGEDADNVRFDMTTNRVYVGYGSGALAIIDPMTRRKIADIPLKAHPESFQLDSTGSRVYVNVPDAHVIAVVDRVQNERVTSWKTRNLRSNFPMALDEMQQHVVVVFRHPAMLGVFYAKDGTLLSRTPTCEDSDDVFVDQQRKRLYVSCGEGFIDTFELRDEQYVKIDRLLTVHGARTSLYVPALDRLFLAVRATLTTPAAIWILRPSP